LGPETASTEDLLARIRVLEEDLGRAERYIETQLKRRSHVFDVILSNLPDLICTFDLQGCFTYANPALLGVWQKTLPEIIGKNTFDLGYPPELAARIQNEVLVVIASGRPVVNHTPFTGALGETRVYEHIFSPVFDGDRSVEEVTCTARDITEEKLQQVFAQAPVAIVVFRGPNFVVELANPFYQALLPGKELVGRPFAEVVPELGEEVWSVFHKVIETGESHIAHEWYIPYDQNGDGVVEDVWFNVIYHATRDATGKIDGMIAVCSDVSVQVRARKELELANRRLEEFAYVASHDMQEPLRMVGIYTQIIHEQSPAENAEMQRYAGFVRQGVERMEHLIRDLLAYSRVTQAEDAAPGVVNLNDALAEALKTMQVRIDETNAKVSVGPLPRVRGEVSQFAHVFQNLLSNSLKYTRKDVPPEIDISGRQNGLNWIVSVRDNGVGFEQQYAQQIFGLFKRLHKDEFSGTGLGLAICQRIVERYGGTIWAEGRPGEGATVYISMPGVKSEER
jgi:PAS domain S-box-containing protein